MVHLTRLGGQAELMENHMQGIERPIKLTLPARLGRGSWRFGRLG